MRYIYAALLLHSAEVPITEENLKKVLSAVGIEADEVRIKALTAALSEINIDEALKAAQAMAFAPIQPPAAPPAAAPPEKEKKAAKEEEEKKEEALAGLSALFG